MTKPFCVSQTDAASNVFNVFVILETAMPLYVINNGNYESVKIKHEMEMNHARVQLCECHVIESRAGYL